MGKDIYIFKRTEKKYFLDNAKFTALTALISEHLVPDAYHEGYVNNIYLDTPDHLLIRNSIDAVSYKEKLRMRAYGDITEQSRAFFELKKKYKGVVYKRRIASTVGRIADYINGGAFPEDSQIMHEIDYAMGLYRHPRPAVFLSYHRLAYKGKEDGSLRITFDNDIIYRFDEVDMLKGRYGTPLIDKNAVLMEIKTDSSVPLWLSHALDSCQVFPSKFSKYGTAYKNEFFNIKKFEGENFYVGTF